jgi:hypothetical protein
VVPGNAVIAGVEPNGDINYICRGPKNQALFTGKGVLKKCLIAFGDDQVETEGNTYEVLLGINPVWQRWDPSSQNWFEGGYEDRNVRHKEPVCLGFFVANQQIPGKLVPFDHDNDGACHVQAGGMAFKEDDRNKFVVLQTLSPPLFEDMATESYIYGYKEALVDGRLKFTVWTGTCEPVNHMRYAMRSLPQTATKTPVPGLKCGQNDVYKYAFPPGSLQ